MNPSSLSLFDNTAANMIDDWIEKNFPVTPLPASPPALESTTPLDTPPDWRSPYFQSPPSLITQDNYVSSVDIIEQKSSPALKYLDDDYSFVCLEKQSSPSLVSKNSLNPPDSPFNLPVAFTSSPDVELSSPPLFLPASPTFSLNPEFKSSSSPGRIVKEEPRSDKIDESGLTSFINQPELAPSTSNKTCCYSPSPPKSPKKTK
ncbi:hypothetical protein O181_121128 [Austropuccinia psidii MF-1]|uniref:Uncharacterized protein n=1 Tax=Austropuccinia psidii MF-1 TaxID=1389203 RepID=A0A9Q3KGY9_9BASI|nr:hypothetical protein [Austropuccinia psidii MF-1]